MEEALNFFHSLLEEHIDFIVKLSKKEYSTPLGVKEINKFAKRIKKKTQEYRDALCVTSEVKE